MNLTNQIEILPWHEFNQFQAYPSEQIQIEQALDGVAVVNIDMLKKYYRSILLMSRMPKVTNSEDTWLNAVRNTLKEAASLGEAIVVSNKHISWKYTAWFAARLALPMVVVLRPCSLEKMKLAVDEFLHEIDANPDTTAFIAGLTEDSLPKLDCYQIRDKMAFMLAHRRFPICLRQKSTWKELIRNQQGVDYRHVDSIPDNYKPEWFWLKQFPEMEEATYPRNSFFHWTRGVFGPWTGETTAQYYSELTASKAGNPRDGFQTLSKIARESLIRGYAKMNRFGESVVSFTSLPPSHAISMMVYRNTLRRWTFEPYGLEFPAESLKAAGVAPVIYGADEDYDKLPDEQKPLFQFSGELDTEKSWIEEAEWRYCGDFDFSWLKDQAVLWTPSNAEAVEMNRLTGMKTTSFEEYFEGKRGF